ncbi:MAG: sugar phosphate isomerase/epimerase [Firmicutes bacterium]|nr:sugar phosphate isomerase/epimerase [Bacillota bacterium]MCL1953267.1 sugar phosphate isomerase/epimerase [Bacillota bacterium]
MRYKNTHGIPFGVSTASFFGICNNEDCFDFYKQNKVEIAEVFLSSTCEYTIEFAQLLNSRKGDVVVHSVHSRGMQYEGELLNVSKRVRDDAFELLHNVCKTAQVLGAKFVTFHGPLKLKRHSYIHNYSKLASGINEVCEVLSKYGLRLSYENIHYGYFDTPEYFERLSTLCPDLYATIDIKQAIQGGKDPIEFLKQCGDRISTIHLCDVGLDNIPCLPIDGTAKWDAIFNCIVQKGIKAPIMLELYSKDYINGVKDIVDCYNILASKLDSSSGNIVDFKIN